MHFECVGIFTETDNWEERIKISFLKMQLINIIFYRNMFIMAEDSHLYIMGWDGWIVCMTEPILNRKKVEWAWVKTDSE